MIETTQQAEQLFLYLTALFIDNTSQFCLDCNKTKVLSFLFDLSCLKDNGIVFLLCKARPHE